MPEAIDPGFIRTVRFTPMRDVVRGRWTGRLDVRARVGAWLPKDATDLIVRVVQGTRLRAMEKIDVADELVAHFADGLAAGAKTEELITSFGDERTAAHLIARAKRRSRHPLVRAMDAMAWMFAVCVSLYILLSGWFYLGRPSPTADYLPIFNRGALSVPESQRAWPIYFAAGRELDQMPEAADVEAYRSIVEARPNTPQWDVLVKWLNARAGAIANVRRASELPQLGFIFGPGGSEEEASKFEKWGPYVVRPNAPLSGKTLDATLQNTMSTLRERVLTDARVAAALHDGDRFVADIRAELNMAALLRTTGFLDGSWPAPFHWQASIMLISRTLAERPEALTDAQLRGLAHLISIPQSAADFLALQNQRYFFYDEVQRMYTDDSHGGGRLTPQGVKDLYYGHGRNWLNTPPWIGSYFVWPAVLVSGASRRDVIDQYNKLMDQAESNLRQPRRMADWSFLGSHPKLGHDSSPLRGNELVLMGFFQEDWPRLHSALERRLGERDGALIGIALEIYHRRHQRYPDALSVLAPDLLPALPVDRITGEALHYRVVDGKPLIYSVGADKKDDGGRAPVEKGHPAPWLAAQWGVGPEKIGDGDWVLYPPQPEDAD